MGLGPAARGRPAAVLARTVPAGHLLPRTDLSDGVRCDVPLLADNPTDCPGNFYFRHNVASNTHKAKRSSLVHFICSHFAGVLNTNILHTDIFLILSLSSTSQRTSIRESEKSTFTQSVFRVQTPFIVVVGVKWEFTEIIFDLFMKVVVVFVIVDSGEQILLGKSFRSKTWRRELTFP